MHEREEVEPCVTMAVEDKHRKERHQVHDSSIKICCLTTQRIVIGDMGVMGLMMLVMSLLLKLLP